MVFGFLQIGLDIQPGLDHFVAVESPELAGIVVDDEFSEYEGKDDTAEHKQCDSCNGITDECLAVFAILHGLWFPGCLTGKSDDFAGAYDVQCTYPIILVGKMCFLLNKKEKPGGGFLGKEGPRRKSRLLLQGIGSVTRTGQKNRLPHQRVQQPAFNLLKAKGQDIKDGRNRVTWGTKVTSIKSATIIK
jgi:hypothetical protein